MDSYRNPTAVVSILTEGPHALLKGAEAPLKPALESHGRKEASRQKLRIHSPEGSNQPPSLRKSLHLEGRFGAGSLSVAQTS